MVKVFEFKKAYEEIEVDGVTYRLPIDDQNLLRMQEELISFGEQAKALSSQTFEDNDVEGIRKNYDEQVEITEKVIDALIGSGSFRKLYASSGNSLMNVFDFLDFLSDVIAEKVEKNKNYAEKKQREYYASKNKKKRNRKR